MMLSHFTSRPIEPALLGVPEGTYCHERQMFMADGTIPLHMMTTARGFIYSATTNVGRDSDVDGTGS